MRATSNVPVARMAGSYGGGGARSRKFHGSYHAPFHGRRGDCLLPGRWPGPATPRSKRMSAQQAQEKVDNGVNVQALLGAREALTEAPAAARFTWRATCNWINGTHSETSVRGFYGLGEEQSHRTEFHFDTDHPEIFASEDHGAT